MNRIQSLCASVNLREIKRGCNQLLGFCIILLFCTCNSPAPQQKEQLIRLKTPEQVAKKWQELVYRNQFEEAKTLSTKNAKDWINWIEKMIVGDNNGSQLKETELPVYLEMKCKEYENKATCSYLMKEGTELFRDSFILVKIDNQWLVDIPEEDMEVDESMEKMLQEMEEILQE